LTSTSRPASESDYYDGLEELRGAFLAKLHNDRVQFVALSAALARAEEDADVIFLDLRDRAHKIRGGAAVFEIPELASAARALEIAAIAAGAASTGNNDDEVWDALVALVRLMGDTGQVIAHELTATSRPPKSIPKLVA
jgi:HPt (histidine-containing phosphotransfer) domain-containing protein